MQTRVSFVSKDMQGEGTGQRIGIIALSSAGFRLVDTSFMYGPIAIFPKTVLSWRVPSPADITPESLELFFVLQPKLDILVVGVGEKRNVDSVRARVAAAISNRRIGYEILPTEDAMGVFNFLNNERRYVGAALFPPEELSDRVTTGQFGQAMHFLRDATQVDENPLLMGLKDCHYDRIKDVCRRIWGNTEEAKHMEAVAKEVRKKRHQEKSEYFEKRRKDKELQEERKKISDE